MATGDDEMNGIPVKLRAPSARGRIFPRYDEESRLIIAGNQQVSDWPIGVNIDTTVILDAGPDRILASVEVIFRRELWSMEHDFVAPEVGAAADIEIREEALIDPDYFIPVNVSTNAARSAARVMFGTLSEGAVSVELSEHCLALVEDDRLRGFYFDLS